MNAVIYARFSSAGQREESIEGQIRECRVYADKCGYTIIETYIDRALSATTDRRPAFQQMIKDAATGAFGVVLCYKHDRFARNRYDAAHYKARLKADGVALEYAAETVPEGPEGILIDSVMEGFAEYYSANLSQNVRRGQYDSALKRYTLGVKVLGLTEGPDRRYMLDENAPYIKKIFTEYADGKPAKKLCDELNALGIRTARGAPFTKNSINKIIRNEKYKGVYRFGDIYDEAGVPAIVSPELWQAANDVAQLHKEAPARSLEEGGYLLTGKLFCGLCGAPMTSYTGTGRSGKLYEYYACENSRAHRGCTLKNVNKKATEDRVVDVLKSLVFDNEIIYKFADYFVEWQTGERANMVELTLAEERVAAIDKKIKNVAEMLCAVPSVTLAAKLPELERERADLLIAIDKLKMETPQFSRDDIIYFLKSFRAGDVDDEKWRIYIVRTFLNAAYIYDDGRLCVRVNGANGLKTKTEPPVLVGSSNVADGLPMSRNANRLVLFDGGLHFVCVVG